ncbi:hypothetical protein HDU93_007177, partial [Gonapodya sp. JEL0774]
ANLPRILRSDIWLQLSILGQLLTQRSPEQAIPENILDDIDAVLQYEGGRRILADARSLPTALVVTHTGSEEPVGNPADGKIHGALSHRPKIKLSVWRGDITSLSNVTAIVNAANSALLGCFQPLHRCIDNVIHSAAGPRLRLACSDIMRLQKRPEPRGLAKITPGFNLPAQFVIHTVGPELGFVGRGGARMPPSTEDHDALKSCYVSCLDTADATIPRYATVHDGAGGTDISIAFCSISTGLFGFPAQPAAELAVRTVVEWCLAHPDTRISHVIFDVFSEEDQAIYDGVVGKYAMGTLIHGVAAPGVLLQQPSRSSLLIPPPPANPRLNLARTWLSSATHLLITAGAGLSAAEGLDYTSKMLFNQRFPAHANRHGFDTLYSVFGYQDWESDLDKWGYYFLHLAMARSWPNAPIYARLLEFANNKFASAASVAHNDGSLLSSSSPRYFVRTTNADGFFVKNGFPSSRVSTPQGSYSVLQCLRTCRPDATFSSEPFVNKALPNIDPDTQMLTDPALVPRCEYCGGDVMLCVRGGDWFNERPFAEGERAYQDFLASVAGDPDALCVVLELGVGMNTPSVVRWADEELVSGGRGGRFRLVRVGKEAAGCVPWELEDARLGVGVDGDIGDLVQKLLDVS